VRDAGAQKTLTYKVYDTTGSLAAQGSVSFTVEGEGQQVPIELKLERRGTFWIEAEVPGWETRETTFCRIPDLAAITGGAPTRFGATNVVWPGPPERVEEVCRIARRIGLSSCRIMHAWYDFEPGPGVYRLEPWAEALEIARRTGIEPWLCIYSPPAWAITSEDLNPSYRAVRVDWDAWRDFVRTATERFKGRLKGWEWLNEIVPGGTPDAVSDYVTMCRIGTETAKAVDPDMFTLLAGGLWPRSFRTEVLRAGAGDYIDVLPIHYANGGAVVEAMEDLAAVGLDDVAVWDNESSRGRNAWGVPPLEELRDTTQARWVLSQWTDELAAGCRRIIFFGGAPDAAGNWSYLRDDLRPRPVAATLAVFTSKMFRARPLGSFSLGEGIFHLFERDGRALLVCSGGERASTVALRVGSDRVRVTDYQGNESALGAPNGVAPLRLSAVPCFLEDADLDVLKAYVAPEVQADRAAMRRSPLGQTPRVPMLTGRPGEVAVRVRNLYDRPLAGSVRLALPAGWPQQATATFHIAPGAQAIVAVPVSAPTEAKDYPAEAVVRFDWDKLPEIRKPFVISAISPGMLGNMIRNGGFEEADESGAGPAGWSVNGRTSRWSSSEGLGLGLGRRVLEFTNSEEWVTTSQAIRLRGGQSYLYTAWVWNRGIFAGSNISQTMADGSSRNLYVNSVFNCGEDNGWWQLYTCRYAAPEGLAAASFIPLARGAGTAYVDNVSVTTFQGTDFAAECVRTDAPPAIDGDLADWTSRGPIPLIGRNQLTVIDPAYQWTPQNLNAVARLRWDAANLYVAVEVWDDVAEALPGERAAQGDCLIIALDPTNRAPDGAGRAFALHVSDAAPGAGGGRHTIYRPQEHSGGLRTGHLFRDSSLYELAVRRGEGTTVYEMRIPWSETGGVQPSLGARFGLSLQLNDNDGSGPAAHMNWGGGLSPAWQPADFGVATCVE